MKKYFCIVSIISQLFNSQQFTEINSDNIQTIQLFNTTTNSQFPIISFNDYLLISFDDTKSSYQRINYTIKHYDRNWNESNLMKSEYIQGYFTDEVRNYQRSFNTYKPYTHYEFQFPSENMKPKISGNYALIVYTKDEKKPLFTRRFSIYENITTISLRQEMFNAGSTELPNQRILATAYFSNENITQNLNQVSLTLLQNMNWNTSIENIKPQFIQTNSLVFNATNQVFFGGNEFYFFDTKNININGLSTQKIMQNELYEHYLFMNEPYQTTYSYNPDVNGNYYIRRNDLGEERVANTEGDYVWVNIALNLSEQKNKNIYVVGLFNNYKLDEQSKMEYNAQGFYEKSLLLKQGYYNYQFAIKDGNNKADFYTLNGNFWQTENQYTALLYFQAMQDRYDRLLGFGEINAAR